MERGGTTHQVPERRHVRAPSGPWPRHRPTRSIRPLESGPRYASRATRHTKDNEIFSVRRFSRTEPFHVAARRDLISTGTPARVAHGMKPPSLSAARRRVEIGITSSGAEEPHQITRRGRLPRPHLLRTAPPMPPNRLRRRAGARAALSPPGDVTAAAWFLPFTHRPACSGYLVHAEAAMEACSTIAVGSYMLSPPSGSPSAALLRETGAAQSPKPKLLDRGPSLFRQPLQQSRLTRNAYSHGSSATSSSMAAPSWPRWARGSPGPSYGAAVLDRVAASAQNRPSNDSSLPLSEILGIQLPCRYDLCRANCPATDCPSFSRATKSRVVLLRY